MPIFHDTGGWLGALRCAVGWGFLSLDTILAGTAVSLASLKGDEGDSAYRLGCMWSRFNLMLMGAEVTVRGLPNLERSRPCVLMANHQSHLDTWALSAHLPGQFRWIVKQELRRVPFFGSASARVGHIFVQRGQSESARRSLALAAERVAGGTSVVFFPEGTRSLDGQLGRLKTGGFRLALEAQVPILPVAIYGTRELMPAKAWRYRSGPILLDIRPPIPTTGRSLDTPGDLESLMEATRAALLAEPELD